MPFHGGSFLVAKTNLLDPNFRQTVVLLIQHSADGAFGLVVNRPVPVKDLPYPVFAGGPCEAEGLFLVHGHADWSKNGSAEVHNEVAPGIFLGDAACAERVKDLPKSEMTRIRMFAGYSGWGPGQLESELSEGVWSVAPANGHLLFDVSPKELWTHLRPPSIPEPSLN